MNKMQMAHEYALEMLKETLPTGSIYGDDASRVAMSIVESAWPLADAMQAEADKREDKTRPEVLEEWQPDWSQAPDDLVKYFAVDENGRGGWYVTKPTLCHDHWYWSDFEERYDNDCYDNAPSFNYQGNWQDSLRKRPEALCEVDWRVAPEWAKYWAIREGSDTALWCINKPTVTGDCFLSHGGCSPAPSFGFTGTHLVVRPQ